MNNESKWLETRSEALSYMRNEEEALAKEWLDDIGYTEVPVGFYINYSKKIMEVYSTQVGILIGKAGVNVSKLEKMLSDKFRGEWKVHFTEIRGFILTKEHFKEGNCPIEEDN